MSSETDKDKNLLENNLPVEKIKNGSCPSNFSSGNSVTVPLADNRTISNQDDGKTSSVESTPPSGAKPARRELPNLQTSSTSSLAVDEKTLMIERCSISDDDSGEILECLDWSCSIKKEDDEGGHNHPRPKSVSFHTSSSLPVERKISNALDCIRYMVGGSSLVKIRPSARQYRRYFSLEEDFSALRWIPSSKKSSKAKLPIRCIREVRMGRTTEVLRGKDISWNYSEDCAFSIIYNDDFESLDLIASSPDEANIWVTGLNVLIGASKSPDTFDERQKMREKWLKEVYDQADTCQKSLSADETVSLITKLNDRLCPSDLNHKIMEFEHGRQGEERGRIGSNDFVSIFKETSTRPEIYFLLIRFSGKDYMNLEDLRLFLEGEQAMTNVTPEECLRIIEMFEPSEEAKQNKQMLIDGFTLFLLSDSCDILDPLHREVCQDMTQPLPHYFVSTSHNTYLLQDQVKGPCSVEGYISALRMGCRCVKVDCWDGLNEPVVYRGDVPSKAIPLVEVFKTIHEFAFVTSPYPLIIHLENHCNLANQEQVSYLTTKIFGDKLYIPSKDGLLKVSQMTPESLKGKIIIKGKKLPSNCSDNVGDVSDEEEEIDISNKSILKKMKLCRALSNLVALTRIRFWDTELSEEIQRLSDVSSFSEYMASKLSQFSAEDMVNHNKHFLTHVYPNSSRVDSSNFNPLEFWSSGCQLVSMNYQTAGLMMDLYQGWFQQNSNCGYVLKPPFLRDPLSLFSGGCAKEPVPGMEPTILYLKIISAQQLPQPKRMSSTRANAIDPYVVVQIYGMAVDCAEARTRTVSNEGRSPIFDESFEFTVTVPELALLRIAVMDDEFLDDDFIGQYTIPLSCLKTGYRHLTLLSNNGDVQYTSTIFIYTTITTRSEKQRLRRKKAWLNIKSVGIKQADDVFKSCSTDLAEAYKMRVDEERAMLDFCKECGVPDSANLVQCLRIFSLRMASCPQVTSWEIANIRDQPEVRVCGELTTCLNKAVSLLEKALMEHNYIVKNAHETLNHLSNLYKNGESVWKDMMKNTSNLGSKGRKVEKVVESFLWNMTILATQTDLLRAVYLQSCTIMNQLPQLMPVLSKLFQKERESVLAANVTDSAVTPVLTNISLMPFPDQLPVTPTSPGDGRLRGILKKTNTPSSVPPCGHQEGAAAAVFFPSTPADNSSR